ncbi:uncharacterized protein LOC127606172 [Hippocampus zosterae]|uniref:uncharacterized protein LOC127606172 n=1 Tax=Hippocampus zosterae TaxID=109293 RepID=UPI00223CA5AA|nr:uncharacterized protein LOC127606172 [Hippocampus zosterae]
MHNQARKRRCLFFVAAKSETDTRGEKPKHKFSIGVSIVITGGIRSTRRKPTQARGESANSTQEGFWSLKLAGDQFWAYVISLTSQSDSQSGGERERDNGEVGQDLHLCTVKPQASTIFLPSPSFHPVDKCQCRSSASIHLPVFVFQSSSACLRGKRGGRKSHQVDGRRMGGAGKKRKEHLWYRHQEFPSGKKKPQTSVQALSGRSVASETEGRFLYCCDWTFFVCFHHP